MGIKQLMAIYGMDDKTSKPNKDKPEKKQA
jgi:hypothetical protein